MMRPFKLWYVVAIRHHSAGLLQMSALVWAQPWGGCLWDDERMAYSLHLNKSVHWLLAALNNQTLGAFLVRENNKALFFGYRRYFLPLMCFCLQQHRGTKGNMLPGQREGHMKQTKKLRLTINVHHFYGYSYCRWTAEKPNLCVRLVSKRIKIKMDGFYVFLTCHS